MLSAMTMEPPRRSASASAKADMPLAVGPAISTACFRSGIAMSSPSTLTAPLLAGHEPLDDAALARVRAILPALEAPIWLARGHAADIPFSAADDDEQRAHTATLR